jgi:hypothetical protein
MGLWPVTKPVLTQDNMNTEETQSFMP